MNALDPVDQVLLLELSRQALHAAVFLGLNGSATWSYLRRERFGGARVFSRTRSVFVTLRKQRQLRGCVGTVEHPTHLALATVENTSAAALRDPRFGPIEVGEFSDIQIELTLLGPLRPMESADQLLIGKHGILLCQGSRRGILLPQVADELSLGPLDFLGLCCRKAGLPEDAWREGVSVQLFTAQHFGCWS